MYSQGDLLQANVTAIAGVLIFLTVAPYATDKVQEIIHGRFTLIAIWITITLFLFSIIALSFVPDSEPATGSRLLFIGGIIGITTAVAGIAGTFPRIERIGKDRKIRKRSLLEDTVSSW